MRYKILLILICVANIIESREYNIKLILTGKRYDNIYLVATTISPDGKNVLNSSNYDKYENSWTFNIPDTITEKVISFNFIFENKNENKNTLYHIYFKSLTNNDTIKYFSFPLDYNIKTIRASYINTLVYDNQFIKYKGKNIIGSSQQDLFLIPFPKNTELEIQSKYPCFGFYDYTRKVQLSYGENLTNYINAVNNYPNSRYLLSEVAGSLTNYKSKGDLLNVFTNFSPEQKHSYIGQKINNFIDKYPSGSEFSNMKLSWWGIDKPKPIIEDTTKYNLIVFSASWCGPCHKLIPDLKNLYNKEYKNLIITYVSIDKAETVKAWNDLMQKENIPWKSLITRDAKVEEFYFVYAIPKMFFVYPGAKKMMEVDIRNIKDLEKMTNLLQN